MFTDMSLTETADTPFFNTYELGFLAWKERFRCSSPYCNNGIQNNVQRGHSFQNMGTVSEQQKMLKDLDFLPPLPDPGKPRLYTFLDQKLEEQAEWKKANSSDVYPLNGLTQPMSSPTDVVDFSPVDAILNPENKRDQFTF
jgi:hypothetical protein